MNIANIPITGNKYLHYLISQNEQELRIDMRDGLNVTRYAKYSHFHVGPAELKFALTVSGFEGNAGKFSFLSK